MGRSISGNQRSGTRNEPSRRPSGLGFAAALVALVFAGCVSGPSPADGPDASVASEALLGGKPSEPPGQAKKGGGGFSDTSVFPGSYRTNGTYSLVLQPGPYRVGEQKVATIGNAANRTQIGYILPVAPGVTEFPVILVAAPYFGPLQAGGLLDSYNANPIQTVRFLVENYVPYGYAVALLPVRGTAANGGCYEWWSEAERTDLRTGISWIKAQSWSADAIGLFGLSLGGGGAWMAAGLGDPAIKTIVPVSSETDLYTWFVRNGTASSLAAPGGVPAYWFLYSLSPFSASNDPMPARDPGRIPDGLQCPGLAEALAASEYMTLTGQPDDPLRYIAKRDLRPSIEANYRGSIFLVTGLNDWLAYPHLSYPWANQLEERGVIVKHLLGQWRHRLPDDPTEGAYFQPTQRVDFAEILLHWFDYWLKGDTSADLGPRVQVADSRMQWRDEKAWPPKSEPARFYLGDGTLAATKAPDGSVIIGPDARRTLFRNETTSPPNRDCPGCKYFYSAPLEKDLRFAGLPRLRVTATPLGPGGVVTAYLYEVQGNSWHRLGWATMDLRFAHGTTAAVLSPTQTVFADLEFEPLDAVAPAGSRLVLELFQGGYGEDVSHFPARALAPAATYRASLPNNPVRIELGGEDTYLVLPDIGSKAKRTFTAPTATPIK